MKIVIRHRHDGRTLYEGEHENVRQAVERASLDGASLSSASLNYASLNGASLNGASLNYASLNSASLHDASLNDASLVAASLVGASLDGASLSSASLIYASLNGAALNGASLNGASLRNASLDGASLDGASLVGASLDGASLDGANLTKIRDDFLSVLDAVPFEVPGLEIALEEGLVNGSTYTGECACLVGTVAKIRECDIQSINRLTPDSTRPAERWFTAISPRMPVTHPVVAITLGWIREWYALKAAEYEAATS